MASQPRLAAAMSLLLFSGPAAASGADGLLAFLVGLPVLVLMSGVLLWVARKPRSVRFLSVLLAGVAPFFLYCLYILPDALSTFRQLPRTDAMIGVVYLALLALVSGLIALLVLRRKVPSNVARRVGR